MKTKMFSEKRLSFKFGEAIRHATTGASDAVGGVTTVSIESFHEALGKTNTKLKETTRRLVAVIGDIGVSIEARELDAAIGNQLTDVGFTEPTHEQNQQDQIVEQKLTEYPEYPAYDAYMKKYEAADMNPANVGGFMDESYALLDRLAGDDKNLQILSKAVRDQAEAFRNFLAEASKTGITKEQRPEIYAHIRSLAKDTRDAFSRLRGSMPQESSAEVEKKVAQFNLFADVSDATFEVIAGSYGLDL